MQAVIIPSGKTNTDSLFGISEDINTSENDGIFITISVQL